MNNIDTEGFEHPDERSEDSAVVADGEAPTDEQLEDPKNDAVEE